MDILGKQRPGTDEAHVALQDVERLWELVETRRTEEPSRTSQSHLVRKEMPLIIADLPHRAELVEGKDVSAAACPILDQQHRPSDADEDEKRNSEE
jgi:hypothetical protein